MDTQQTPGQIWLAIFSVDLLRYLIPAAAFFVVLWLGRKALARYRIQQTPWRMRQYLIEIGYSVSTAAIFATIGFGLFWAKKNGHTLIYEDRAMYGEVYYYASFFIMMLIHDAYFYWSHRAMHAKPLYKLFHKVHHYSRQPSPWAAYAFAPAEAIIEALFYVVLLFLLPFHVKILFAYLIFMIVRNIWGHMGYELLPHWFAKSKLFAFSSTTTHHDLHHASFNYNYALYFTWWDRLMKTEHPDYAKQFELNARGKAEVSW